MTTREKLTAAMSDLLWERGYAATSPRDILERAGVGQGSMYHHFSGKHELAVETLRETVPGVTERSLLLAGEGSPMERIRAYLTLPRPGTRGCRIGRMTQDPQVVQDAEMIAIVAGGFDLIIERWQGALSAAIEAGELPVGIDPADLAHTLVAVIQGGYVLARAHDDQASMDAAIRGALALLEAAGAPRPEI
ncbi:TetR/AcrR family transcriptional regulator [Mycetocola tolaasinivorans]|uniref:TetR/AcrR family transcriptional regulator n=1 Tax=Mycetocola tolaasinivorans TaxID=76635 RepID=A0A3L7ACA9_9MICO|nr:TetR/AcrR family transcriptional regulator [Mycetocola tolaasinivorans]RLP77368.1 TetR/AcrR family transcriptional regulator [Mycetocola tolaasinivorans]